MTWILWLTLGFVVGYLGGGLTMMLNYSKELDKLIQEGEYLKDQSRRMLEDVRKLKADHDAVIDAALGREEVKDE